MLEIRGKQHKKFLIRSVRCTINCALKNLLVFPVFETFIITPCRIYGKYDYSSFTKLWQSCSDPHPKISPIAIFAFYSLNYSLVAHLQDNSRPKSPTKIETKRKLQQFTVSGWLIINGGESGSEQIKM